MLAGEHFGKLCGIHNKYAYQANNDIKLIRGKIKYSRWETQDPRVGC